jgi:DNA polymerase
MPGTLWLDIETFSCTNLKTAGVYRYVEDPTFEILMCSWTDHPDKPVQVALGEQAILQIPGLRDPDVVKVAHNAGFERISFSAAMGLPVGEYLPAEEWRDTQAIAAELGYPQKLEQLAKALGVEQKDTAGTRLINLFCKLYRGRRVRPEEKPEQWAQFVEYNRQDTVVLVAVDQKMGGRWPTRKEHQVWLADQRINDRGIRADADMARRAYHAAQDNRMLQELEISSLTGVANPGSVPQMMEWFRSEGMKIPNLQAKTIEKVLSKNTISPKQRKVLELRQELALTASKKYTAALASVCSDGRFRGGFRFYGAHTGRWAGRGVQLHNLPRASFTRYDPETDSYVWDHAAEQAAIMDLLLGLGVSASGLKKLVRALFHLDGAVVDYASIEARVLAWMAGEEWALQAFRDGRDIYVETAERMGGLTRAQGKVAVLALGYNGGLGSLAAMGARGNDEELQALVYQWRAANPNIVRLWKTMETSFRHGGPVGAHISIERSGEDRLMRLPSGRAIVYRSCRFGQRISFASPRLLGREETYGGRLVENATQAIARDILAEALVRLERAGYPVVGHVHDEILVEQTRELAGVTRVMTEVPRWATGLPIDAEGFLCERYRKG